MIRTREFCKKTVTEELRPGDVVQHFKRGMTNFFNTYVRQHGALIGEFHTRKSHRRANICSAAKSVTSIGIGIAIDEGLITLDTKPVEILKA